MTGIAYRDFKGNIAENLADPVRDQDAATKGYADTAISTAVGAITVPVKATVAETNTGTDDTKFLTPADLSGSVLFHAPEGFLINGKIVPSVASNNLTVAIKGMDGNDPSATNPVYCRIGSVIRSITTATSSTQVAGYNYGNAGSAELATKEIDWFVYLVWDTDDAVVKLGFSRIPYANVTGDFSATDTNEKAFLCNTDVETVSTDQVVNIGRFAATLSAGTGYTWTVPTFTATNLIQRPIYETRESSWIPVLTAGADLSGYTTALYKLVGSQMFIKFLAENKSVTTSGSIQISLPLTPKTGVVSIAFPMQINAGAGWIGHVHAGIQGGVIEIYKTAAAGGWAGSETGVYIRLTANHEV